MAALAVRAPGAGLGASRCDGPRGRLARRRRRGPEGLRAADGAQARNVPRELCQVTGESCAASGSAHSSRGVYQDRRPAGPGALRAPLKTYGKSSRVWDVSDESYESNSYRRGAAAPVPSEV